MADAQHLEASAAEMGLTGAKGVASPYATDESNISAEALRQIRLELLKGAPKDSSSPLLSEADTKRFMSVAAMLNFLAADRPDAQFAVKELMRKMSCPTEADQVALKRTIRYLLTCPRCVSVIP